MVKAEIDRPRAEAIEEGDHRLVVIRTYGAEADGGAVSEEHIRLMLGRIGKVLSLYHVLSLAWG